MIAASKGSSAIDIKRFARKLPSHLAKRILAVFSLPEGTSSSLIILENHKVTDKPFCLKYKKFEVNCFASQTHAERLQKELEPYARLKAIGLLAIVGISDLKFNRDLKTEEKAALYLVLSDLEELKIVDRIAERASRTVLFREKDKPLLDKPHLEPKKDLSEFKRKDLLFAVRFVMDMTKVTARYPEVFKPADLKKQTALADEIRRWL